VPPLESEPFYPPRLCRSANMQLLLTLEDTQPFSRLRPPRPETIHS
jgi:hypothetical protein